MIKIGKEISKRNFDVVNNHNFPTEWAVYFTKKYKDVPSVWMCNEPPFWFFQEEARKGLQKIYWPLFEILDKVSIKSIDKIVVLSKLMGEIVKEVYGQDYIVVISGVDIKEFEDISGKDFRKTYELDDVFVLLQVGIVTHYKRQDIKKI